MKKIISFARSAAALALAAILSPSRAAAQNLFVTIPGFALIVKYAPNGAPSTFVQGTTNFYFPQGLAFDSSGDLFVTSLSF